MEDKIVDYTYLKESMGDDDLVKSFIEKIRDQIQEYLEKIDKLDDMDYLMIYNHVHSIKGIASYCFPRIYQISAEICTNLKSKKYDNLQRNLDKIRNEYKVVENQL